MSSAIGSRWPPKSPHEALLSSPSGRDRIRRAYDRTSPSPSPYRARAGVRRAQIPSDDKGGTAAPVIDDDDEDEETLRLKLQAIEAKLKLKRLQQKQGKDDEASSSSAPQSSKLGERKENIPPATQRNTVRAPRSDVQIAGSPHRSSNPPAEQRSPGRVLLGIDKGLKGRNISLKRPRKEQHQSQDDFWQGEPDAKQRQQQSVGRRNANEGTISGKSFSERIADNRKSDGVRLEREISRHAQRSKGFNLAKGEIDASRHSLEEAELARQAEPRQIENFNRDGFSREQIMKALKKEDRGVVQSRRTKNLHDPDQVDSMPKVWMNPNAQPDFTRPSQSKPDREKKPPEQPSAEEADDHARKEAVKTAGSSDQLFEPFSTLHLSKRILTQDILTRTFTGKSVLRVMDLLANVKSPEYLLPESMEADYVVTGIIATKSSPLNHKETTKTLSNAQTTSHEEATSTSQNTKGKFMVIQLTDLKWTVDLYLFTTAYTRFYKLTPGTVVAILNPGIMPPPPGKGDTGRFSLTLNSSDDTVLEIGTARDLGWCKATRKDGKPCTDWIDKRHTEYCEFHVDRVIQQVRRGRMEVNSMSAPFAPGGKKQGRTGFFGGEGKRGSGAGKRWSKGPSDDGREGRGNGLTKEGQRYDRTTSSTFFVAPPIPGRTAAELLDREDILLNRGGSKEERTRKRLAEREREDEIAKRLGDRGNGAGANYLRMRQTEGVSTLADMDRMRAATQEGKVDARSLGLLENKAKDAHISPIKKPGLKRKEGRASLSPRKKTRFVLEKGIREAGRESLPMVNNDDDDDDLEIG